MESLNNVDPLNLPGIHINSLIDMGTTGYVACCDTAIPPAGCPKCSGTKFYNYGNRLAGKTISHKDAEGASRPLQPKKRPGRDEQDLQGKESFYSFFLLPRAAFRSVFSKLHVIEAQ
jgi:hypothetical protein